VIPTDLAFALPYDLQLKELRERLAKLEVFKARSRSVPENRQNKPSLEVLNPESNGQSFPVIRGS
jgi:hypothetical protein